MPQPQRSESHYDAVSSAISTAFIQDSETFVAGRVFPLVPVPQSSGKFTEYQKDAFLRDEMGVRAPGGVGPISGYGISRAQYLLEQFSLFKQVPDEMRRDQSKPVDLDGEAVLWLAQKALIRQEVAFASAFMASSLWGTTTTPGNLWSAYSTSTPIADVKTAKGTIQAASGFKPNVLVLGQQVFDALLDHPEIVARLTSASSSVDARVANKQILARIFDVERIEVMAAIKATAEEGAASQAYAYIGGKHALLAYAAPSPSLYAPSAGYTFMLEGPGSTTEAPIVSQIFKTRDAKAHTDEYEIQTEFQHKLVAAALGYFFASVVA